MGGREGTRRPVWDDEKWSNPCINCSLLSGWWPFSCAPRGLPPFLRISLENGHWGDGAQINWVGWLELQVNNFTDMAPNWLNTVIFQLILRHPLRQPPLQKLLLLLPFNQGTNDNCHTSFYASSLGRYQHKIQPTNPPQTAKLVPPCIVYIIHSCTNRIPVGNNSSRFLGKLKN